jgi:hypothetical protein
MKLNKLITNKSDFDLQQCCKSPAGWISTCSNAASLPLAGFRVAAMLQLPRWLYFDVQQCCKSPADCIATCSNVFGIVIKK